MPYSVKEGSMKSTSNFLMFNVMGFTRSTWRPNRMRSPSKMSFRILFKIDTI